MAKTLYRKNIREWEQWSRVLLGAALVVGAFLIGPLWLQIICGATGATLAVTGIVGWCPACAMVGRKLGTK